MSIHQEEKLTAFISCLAIAFLLVYCATTDMRIPGWPFLRIGLISLGSFFGIVGLTYLARYFSNTPG